MVPDELVTLDLATGRLWPIFSPNVEFRDKTRGVTVRVIRIPVSDRKLYGHLFLPSSHNNNQRYPLVITTYLSTPGFNVGSGEVPVLPLVTHGIAVFAMDARETNDVARNKNFEVELGRLEKPLNGMAWVVEELSKESVIDPERVGLNGHSYGTEIAMYAYWKSSIFRAVSATTGSWGPMLYPMVGLGFAELLKDRGFPDPKEDRAYEQWKRISAGLNARSTLPPLLWQSPDSERQMCVEAWLRLRRAGAQVEWIEYPDEDHVKHNPSDMWWVEQRNLDWFRFWLKGEEDPDPAKAEQYVRWREMRMRLEAAKVAPRESGNR
jgi:hypothetical protein